ncbi:hypothetical protein [Bartonella raoultii]|uniref:Integral membrane protein n=1 Tax=Bartonella raoultii TaxID=1457020 RepID=A0ABS7IA63_9HYPH|nr:hypothetical protein [Bartonella raoultii]MBX4336488.1 hypothetical protein [Bartonella raoultii]
MKMKNSIVGISLRFFSFKNCNLMFQNALIRLCLPLIIMVLASPAFAGSLVDLWCEKKWYGLGNFIFLLPVVIWICIFAPLLIFWGLHSIRDRKLKKTMQQLEDFPEQ